MDVVPLNQLEFTYFIL
jgi:hypothetical protein